MKELITILAVIFVMLFAFWEWMYRKAIDRLIQKQVDEFWNTKLMKPTVLYIGEEQRMTLEGWLGRTRKKHRGMDVIVVNEESHLSVGI